jgi:hypothetical protein
MRETRDWIFVLDDRTRREIEDAIVHAKRTKKPTRALSAREFPLPTLAPQIEAWRREVSEGRGFVLIRGVPVERWDPGDAELFFWCFGLHFGMPGAQNKAGDLLGHVVDTGEDPDAREVRRYRTAANIAYHCDAADAVGLLCLRKAKSGGESRIVSSTRVYNELLARRPDLAARLYSPFFLDTRGDGGVDYFPIAPCRYDGDRLRTFWHSDYFRSAFSYTEIGEASPLDREVLSALDLRRDRRVARALPRHGSRAG